MPDDNDTDDTGAPGTDSGRFDQVPESLLPYDLWTEEALRHVVVRALTHAAEHGLPGEHHFYLTFRTDMAGVVVPPHLRAQYPREMTIVLQHQFWGLRVDTPAGDAHPGVISVGLSFGGVPSTLVIPLRAVTAFADPQVRYGLRFRPIEEAASPAALPKPAAEPDVPDEADAGLPAPDPTPQVVSLDAFRRRPPPKEGA